MTEGHKAVKTSVSMAVAGSGGAGVITVGNLLLEAAARFGYYGMLTRSVGPQIRGGEAVSLIHLNPEPISCLSDQFDILLAIDWNNVDRFAEEIPLGTDSIIIADPAQGEVPAVIAASGAGIHQVPIAALAKQISKGRQNMVALGILSEILGLTDNVLKEVLQKQLGEKGEEIVRSSLGTIETGRQAASSFVKKELVTGKKPERRRWIINGNQATGYGALRGGVRFVAAYPITPATEVLEWMSTGLNKTGGRLVQAEDELASINMIIGASFGGVPSLTATSGPGLSLMMEGIGLAVSAEIPVVVVDVMRVGPSTGVATKPEQSDLNIAVYGLHGDAPHPVLAPLTVSDCLFTAQWSVYLAEAMQVPVIMLSDQHLGQALSIVDRPEPLHFTAIRNIDSQPAEDYQRYAITGSGVSPMTIPGTPGGQYTADGLEHTTAGIPSTRAEDHAVQLDKRFRKITKFDYGEYWAEMEGNGELAVITWGSTTGTIREALKRLRKEGIDNVRFIAIRLLAPVQKEKFISAMEGVGRVLVIEQNHSAQFYHYLRANYDLPSDVEVLHRAGPLLFRPAEIFEKIKSWSHA